MPNPKRFKDRASFMRECVPTMIREGRKQDVAVAACSNIWRNRNKRKQGATMANELRLPKLRAMAPVVPESLNEEKRTIEVRFYSGAAVQRMPLFDDPYELSFSLDKDAVRLARFNAGAPLVDNHNAYGSVGDVVLGVVEEAWLTKDGGHARVRIAPDRPDILARLKDGILRNFSMGAVIHTMRDITEKGDKQRRLLAVDWEPHELSIVPVGADPGAQVLSPQQPEMFRCTLLAGANGAEEPRMDDIDTTTDGEQVDKKPDVPASEKLTSDARKAKLAVEEAIEADRSRSKEIRRLQVEFGLDENWSIYHIKNNSPIELAISDAAEKRAANKPRLDPVVSLGEDFTSIGWRTDRMAEALASRAMRKAPPDAALQYARSSIAECALECLELNGRARNRGLDARRDPGEVIKLALHTTSDFPLLLANTLNKTLQPAYELATPVHRQIAVQKTFRDFRAHNFYKQGDFPAPAAVNEHGEFTSGTMAEGSEVVTPATYGRILGISRQILVNDDLGAFNDLGAAAARRVVDFEENLFFTTCILAGAGLGPTLTEGSVAVYNAAHANITAGGAIDNARLGEALALMLAQTSLDGMKLSIMPGIVLVPPASFVTAKTLLADIYPATAANVNPFAGQMVALTSAWLTGTRFYVLAAPGPYSNYVYGSIDGQGGPVVEAQNGFRIDGVEVKLRRDFGCGAVDFRFGVTGAGA